MTKPGDGRRVARMEKEVQQAIAGFVLRDLRDDLPGMVTISGVRMPGDLKSAKVAVSLLAPGEDEARLRDEAVEILQSWASDIQQYIAAELKLRFCPKLTFVPDESTDRVLRIESTLRSLSSRKDEGE